MALPASGYDLATISNPASALTNFTLIVDLSRMSSSWWADVNSSDGTRGRAAKGDGTELACDWIDFDSSGETGILRVLWTGTLASSGTQQVRIYPPNTRNAAVAADATYGSDNAYDSSWLGYWPLVADANDRTVNGNDGTGNGGVSVGGGGAGLLGDCTYFDGTDDWVSLDPVFTSGDTTFSTIVFYKGTDGTGCFFGCGNSAQYAYRHMFDFDSGSALRSVGDSNLSYSTSTPDDNNWHQLFWEYSSVGIDGAIGQTGTMAIATGTFDNSGIGTFNRNGSVHNPIQGYMQHVSCHDVNRAEDWVAHEYDQVSDNATFWGTWAWQSGSGATTIVPIIDHHYQLMGMM